MTSTPTIDKVFARMSVPLTLADAREADYPIIRANAPFCRMAGYIRADVLGRNCRFMQGTMRDQPGRYELANALKERRDVQVVLRNFTRYGDPFDNLLFIHHLYGLKGELLYVMGSQFRIEDRESAKALDLHLVALDEGLGAMVGSHIRMQMAIRRQLSNSMAAMLDSAILRDRLDQPVGYGGP